MQISSRFTIAIHMLIAIDLFKNTQKATSALLASSVNTNPVIIRRIVQQLKAADLIEVTRGTGGAELKKEASKITLYDIYLATDCVENGDLFHFHEDPNEECPIGRNIHAVLDRRLQRIQEVFENEMKQTSLADVSNEMKQLCVQQKAKIEDYIK